MSEIDSSPPSAQFRHLRTLLAELQRKYDLLTRRIAALETDIGRELDSERKLVLQERRTDLGDERDQVAVDIERIEQQLAGSSMVTITDLAPAQTSIEPVEALSPAERTSLQRQLAELRENLRLIEERKSQFVQETDVPLQLIKEERGVHARIAELEQRRGALSAMTQASSGPGSAAIPKVTSILFNEGHGQDRWFVEAPTTNKGYGRIAAIIAECARVAVLSAGNPIRKETLSGQRALVLPIGPQAKTQLTDEEIQAVQAFVRAGGGLVVLGAYTGDWHHEANLNRLLEAYGIVFNRDVVMPANAKPSDGFSQGADRLPTSPSVVEILPAEEEIGPPTASVRAALVKGVTKALTISSCSLYADEGVAVSVLRSQPDSLILEPVPLGVGIHIQRYMERGRGPATIMAASTRSKVVVAGSWKMFLDAFIDHPLCGNQQLFRNILAWLLD